MIKQSLLVIFSFASLHAGMESCNALEKSPSLLVPHKLGHVKVMHSDNDGFTVLGNGRISSVQNCFMDKELRNINKEQLIKFSEVGYLSLDQMSDGNYTLKHHIRLNGGGVIGANVGFWGGKALVYAVGHGTITAISGTVGFFCPPAGPVVHSTLEYTFAAPIEAASNVVAVAGALTLGTLTGPA